MSAPLEISDRNRYCRPASPSDYSTSLISVNRTLIRETPGRQQESCARNIDFKHPAGGYRPSERALTLAARNFQRTGGTAEQEDARKNGARGRRGEGGESREKPRGHNRKRRHKAEMINATGILNGVAVLSRPARGERERENDRAERGTRVRVYRARFTRSVAIEGDRAAGERRPGEQEPPNGEAEGPGDRRDIVASILAFVIRRPPVPRLAIAIADSPPPPRRQERQGTDTERELGLFNWPFLTDEFNERRDHESAAASVCFRFPSYDSSRISDFCRTCVRACHGRDDARTCSLSLLSRSSARSLIAAPRPASGADK